MRTLELLAPAKNLECGCAAIDHGADAVYIGAERMGARAAAGNSIDDIQKLVDYAHQYGAKVYVTVNTIIYEQELASTQSLITELSRIHVDALLVQDMATLAMRRVTLHETGSAPVLHASTQCDTRSADKVRWLRDLGFKRAVLARELSIDEIAAIHKAVPDIELEVFVHGALCVSYSGVCYASQFCFNRSANRGECAQFCRMKFDLIDADGRQIVHDKHLLSLKDMNQADSIEALADAGAASFKIEGRLKDISYVKNVVSAYSKRLDELINKRPDDYCRASLGRVEYGFDADLCKTFNRGYTHYFLKGRRPDISSPDTPKALGEAVGHVKEIRKDSFNVAGTSSFSNGDGLCFLNSERKLEGFRVNRAIGNRLFPFRMPRDLRPGTVLYRNHDVCFERHLDGDHTVRKIPVQIMFETVDDGFSMTMSLQNEVFTPEVEARAVIKFEHQQARKPQEENIRQQLGKLGNTPFKADAIDISADAINLFIPSSLLSNLRQSVIMAFSQKLSAVIAEAYHAGSSADMEEKTETTARFWQSEYRKHPYLFNISNHLAREFYEAHGLKVDREAFEVKSDNSGPLMQCCHCIRYTMGFCVRRGGQKPQWREPLQLRLGDGRRFRLDFKCDECQMNVVAIPSDGTVK